MMTRLFVMAVLLLWPFWNRGETTMLEEIQRKDWLPYFNEFNERNRLRPTRLEVIGNGDSSAANFKSIVETDYWMEDGLPLLGVSLEPNEDGAPRVEVMLGGEHIKPSAHMMHTVEGAQRIVRTLGKDGRECELEIEDKDGAVSSLHFFSWP
jgi:flavodoxin